jgi:hypothetical protein
LAGALFSQGQDLLQSLKTANKQAAISAAKQFFHIKTAELYVSLIAFSMN